MSKIYFAFVRLISLFPFFLLLSSHLLQAANITLSADTATATLGQPVTLTAAVTPGATGRVTFYDGASFLGIREITGNTAVLTTVTLPAGTRSLRAYYWGDAQNTKATSAPFTLQIRSAPSYGLRRATSYQAPGTDIGSILAADLNGDRKVDIVVPTLGTNTVNILLGKGDGTLQLRASYSTGVAPRSVVAGDWNADGKIDLAVANSVSSTIGILLGNGDGTFQPADSITGVPYPTWMATGDFNADGRPDLVTASEYSFPVIVLGSGDGAFAAPTPVTGLPRSAGAPVVDDFNRDGFVDILFSPGYYTSAFLAGVGNGTFQAPVIVDQDFWGRFVASDLNSDEIFVTAPGNGDGTFQSPWSSFQAMQASPSVVVADWNGDGLLDLLAMQGYSILTASGNGDGTVQTPVITPSQVQLGQSLATDLNGDGQTDLVSSAPGAVYVMLGGAAPDLLVTTASPAGFNATKISGQDWTCNPGSLDCSRSDILPPGAYLPPLFLTAVAPMQTGSATATATVAGDADATPASNAFRYTANIRTATSTSLTTTPNPSALSQRVTLTATVSAGTGAVAFYDGSELLGYAVLTVSGQASLSTSLLASGTRNLTAQYAGDANYGPSLSAPLAHRVQPLSVNAVAAPIDIPVYKGSSFAFADLNRDGKLDLIHLDIGGVATRLGNGDGTFQSSPFAFGMQHVTSVLRAGDFNADGYPDVMAYGFGKLTVLMSNGDGSVRRSVELTVPDYSAIPSLYAVDIDQDGKTDIALVGPGLVVYRGKGDGTFEAPVTPITQLLDGGRLADFNNDGLPDILLLRGGSLPTQVFPGKGDGTFLSPVNTTQPSALIDLAAAGDFSGDGKSDAIGVSQNSAYTQLGNGNGSFQLPFASSPATGIPVPDPNPATGDFDGDGKLDLAFKVNSNSSLAILFGRGDGTFNAVSTLPAPTGLGDIVSADFNSDGRPDIAVGGANASFIRIYLGRQDFGVDLTAAHDGAFSSGAAGFYELTLTNRLLSQPPATATVAFTMPAGMTLTNAAGSAWTCSASSCTSTSPLSRGTPYPPISLSVAVAAGLSSTILTPQFTVTFGGASKAFPEPTTIATAEGYAGLVETSSCNGISGWALNLNSRNQSITVSLWNGGVRVASVLANALRSDIGLKFTDNGLHGFLIPIPTSLADGLSRTLEVRFESSAAPLNGSPVTLKCGATPSQPSYTGYVDTFSCAAGISGWAADRNRLNQPITVTLWNGATQLASVLASAARSDVGGVLGDNGLHGFTIPIPAAVADGVSRSLQIRFETSGTQVAGSPVTIMCGSGSGGGGGGGAAPSYTGYVDTVSCATGISGWAADRNRLNQSIRVTLWDGATQIASVLAADSRPDVGFVLGDNGIHGFTMPIPAGYADGVSRQLQVRFETSTAQLSSSPATVKCGTSGGGGPVVTPSYAGFVDSVSCSGGISGWAADRNRLNQSIQVSLWDGATQVASGLANISRPDVGAFLGDNGMHGFSIPIPSAYANGTSRSLQVRFDSTSTPLGNSPATFTCGTPPPGGGGTAPNYTGWVDATSCSAISGWAADRNRLNQAINVDLVEGSTVLASVLAGALRSDVGAVLGDNGLHGFSIPTPAGLKDGAVHNIQLRYGGTSTALPNSPQTLQCANTSPQPNYTGYVDRVGCDAISGWAADRNRLNTSIGIEIYLDGSTLLAAIPASLPRPDVGAVLGDNGNHGFNFIPLQLNDGRPHVITVRPTGGTASLPGPQTLTCP